MTTESSPRIEELIQFGDYNGMDIVMSNAIAVYTDTRNETGGSGESADIYAIDFQVAADADPKIFADGFESGDTTGWN